MNELVYCCPKCHAVSSSGISVDGNSADCLKRIDVPVSCPCCRVQSLIAFSDLMLTESFTDEGGFAQMIGTG